MNRVHTISGRDHDSQMIPGAWTQSSVANPAYGTRTCTAAFAPRRARNDCAKTGTVSSGAQTGGETGGWRRGCRGKTRAVRCPPTPLVRLSTATAQVDARVPRRGGLVKAGGSAVWGGAGRTAAQTLLCTICGLHVPSIGLAVQRTDVSCSATPRDTVTGEVK